MTMATTWAVYWALVGQPGAVIVSVTPLSLPLMASMVDRSEGVDGGGGVHSQGHPGAVVMSIAQRPSLSPLDGLDLADRSRL